MSADGAHPFRIKKNKRQGIVKEQISFQMQKICNVLASKLQPVKTFKGNEMLLYRRGVLVGN